MADISIDFHALPDEQRDFVKQCVDDFGLHTIAILFPPYSVAELVDDAIDEVFSNSWPYRQLAFTIEKPNVSVSKEIHFQDINPDSLWLDIGKITKEGLVEAGFSARTDNTIALSIWKKIAKRLKKLTKKGALAVQVDTGATGSVRTHRYTSGAKSLEDEGTNMLAITGNILKLGQI